MSFAAFPAGGWSGPTSAVWLGALSRLRRQRAVRSRWTAEWRRALPGPSDDGPFRPTFATDRWAAATALRYLISRSTSSSPRPGRAPDSCSTGTRPRAAPCRSQWVGLNIPQHRKQVLVVLDHGTLEPSLPDMAARAVMPMVPLRMPDQQALHDPADRAPLAGRSSR